MPYLHPLPKLYTLDPKYRLTPSFQQCLHNVEQSIGTDLELRVVRYRLAGGVLLQALHFCLQLGIGLHQILILGLHLHHVLDLQWQLSLMIQHSHFEHIQLCANAGSFRLADVCYVADVGSAKVTLDVC